MTLADESIALSPSVPKPFYQQTTFTLSGIILNIREDNSGNLSSRDYVLQKLIPLNEYTKNAKITPTTLDKVSGVVVEGLVSPVSGDSIGPVAYIAKGNKIISIELNPRGISNATSIFNRTLSTFRFD